MQTVEIESHMQQGRWQEALGECRRMLQDHPTNARLHGYAGVCEFRLENWANAELAFRTATTLDPKFVDAGIKHAQCLDRLKDYEQAFLVAKEWLRHRPNDNTLQGLIYALEHQVRGNRKEGWQIAQGFTHAVVLAEDARK